MRRRSFFGVIAAAAVGAAFGTSGPSPPAIRAVYRYSYATDTWTRCRLYEVRSGDVFRFDDQPAVLACGSPDRDADGIWGIVASHQIDPATNQWVAFGAET
jgi:hypothetical protein